MKPDHPQRPSASRRTNLRRFGALVTGTTLLVAVPLLAADSSPPTSLTDQLKKLSFEELMEVKVGTVYAASKREQKTTEAPASVSIVTSDDIQKFGYQTLADVLRSVRGFYITYDRSYSYVGGAGRQPPRRLWWPGAGAYQRPSPQRSDLQPGVQRRRIPAGHGPGGPR